MTLSYLDIRTSAVIDSNGNAKCSLAPPTGQYWLPTQVHIGEAGNNIHSPTSQAGINGAIFAGAPGIQDFTTVVDVTWRGTNDTSSLLSGKVISPGQAISAAWQFGFPGDTVMLSVVGVSSDVPPTLGVIPWFPGSRFAGNTATQMVSPAAPTQNGSFQVSLSQDRQITPNQFILGVDTGSLASGATHVILPPVPNNLYALFDLYLNPITTTTIQFNIETTDGSAIDIIQVEATGAPVNAFLPPIPPLHYSGALLPSGLGLQIHNTLGAGNERLAGHLVYSTFP